MQLAIEALFILQRWSQGSQPRQAEIEQLWVAELAHPKRAKALIGTAEPRAELERRSQLFQSACPQVQQLCQQLGLEDSQVLATLWSLWLPLAVQLASEREKLGRTLIQGILGGQGTGKTTLAVVLRLILDRLGYSTLALSLDDLYKTYAERHQLQQQDPRLIWRGPPGTHDVQLGVKLLEKLRHANAQEPIAVPRFDKSAWGGAGDRAEPEWVKRVDIVLFEGWFVGVRPVKEEVFDSSPPPLTTPEACQFGRDTNARLKSYLPLWKRLDRLMVLYPVDYQLCKQWRREAEQAMIASGKSGMSDVEVEQFVEYFWRALHPELFITPLIRNRDRVDLIIEINADHTPGNVYRPGDSY